MPLDLVSHSPPPLNASQSPPAGLSPTSPQMRRALVRAAVLAAAAARVHFDVSPLPLAREDGLRPALRAYHKNRTNLIRWLHLPQCGQSFVLSAASHACWDPRRVDHALAACATLTDMHVVCAERVSSLPRAAAVAPSHPPAHGLPRRAFILRRARDSCGRHASTTSPSTRASTGAWRPCSATPGSGRSRAPSSRACVAGAGARASRRPSTVSPRSPR